MIPKEQTHEHYTCTILIKSNPQSAFDALTTGIAHWWGQTDGPSTDPGDIFTVSWGEPWYRFRIIESAPGKKVSWVCVDANQIIDGLEGVKTEWVGTRLHWSIRDMGPGEVELTLVHEGLVPEFICYDFCSNTWDNFIAIHLKKYLEG